jgi:peroxiredoxin Q/BCP
MSAIDSGQTCSPNQSRWTGQTGNAVAPPPIMLGIYESACASLKGDAMAVNEGSAAPSFTLESSSGKKVSLKDFKGKKVVLYFYPKDDTPGCTKEACSFRESIGELKKMGAVVLGVSPDDMESHRKFIKKYNLPFELLADTDHAVAEKYGVWKEKSMYGRKYMGVERSTFLIGPDGRVQEIFRKVKVSGHVEELIEKV